MGLNSEDGFSLIELILVITIIGILISMVIPGINMNKFKIDSYARQIYSALVKARQIAIAEAEDCIIYLLPGNQLIIKKNGEGSYLELIEVEHDFTISCTRASKQLKFTPLGTAVAGTFIISDGFYTKKIIVAPNGFIRIE